MKRTKIHAGIFTCECEMWHVDWDSRDFEPPSSPHFHRRLESGPQSARMPKYCVFSTAPIHR